MSPPRKLLPTLLPKPSRPEGSHQTSNPTPRDTRPLPRRQLVSQACENCRKRKVKCDAARPQCGPCTKANLECQYAMPKADALNRYMDYRSVFELLREQSLAESTQVLQGIREADDLDDTVSSFAQARLLLQSAIGSSVGSQNRNVTEQMLPTSEGPRPTKRRLRSPHDDSDFIFEKQFMTEARHQYVDKDIFIDIPDKTLPLSKWTDASDDDRLMSHLMRMFWTWDNIVEKTLYRPIFEEDLINMDPLLADDDSGSFCSRFLVNSLLALSSLYTMDTATFKDPGDPATRGRRWMDEADALLSKTEDDKASIPLLQGLLALFCYEGNLGLGTKAIPYYMRAMDVYKALNTSDNFQHRGDIDEGRAQQEGIAVSWCIWGFYCCEWRGTQALGLRKFTRRPVFPKAWQQPDFPLSQSDSSGYWWYAYPMSCQVQRSMKVEIREVDAILSEIAEEALDFIYPEAGGIPPSTNPQRALELYRAIVAWKESCPSRLRLEEAVLPSALLLHASAEVMLTAILRPFTHLSKAEFGRFDPRERCYAHASSLASVIWTFRAFAVIRFEYWLTHALGTAAYIVVGGTEDAPMQMDTLMRACQCLYEMRIALPLATDTLCGIYVALKRSAEPVPEFMSKYWDKLRHRKDGLLHYSVTALLPNATNIDRVNNGEEMQLQELLSRLDDIKID